MFQGFSRFSLKLSMIFLLLGVSGGFAGIAHAADNDPWYSYNKTMFAINDYVDSLVIRPAAVTYKQVVPDIARQGVRNFFRNINDINIFANNLMQFKFSDALSDSGRFLVNTTVGVGGLFDIASRVGLQKHEEDFGQTLGFWNIPSGPYVVLPGFGSSTVRDTFGLLVDALFNPFAYNEDIYIQVSAFSIAQLNNRSELLNFEELVSGDEYLFLREAYLQRRRYQVDDGASNDNFSDFDF